MVALINLTSTNGTEVADFLVDNIIVLCLRLNLCSIKAFLQF